ncbi:MAG: pyridoxamine 5'-phosphate oxidase family protein [Spirochaetales bacterium]|nr:pyridoxamine 5'-phosphate oxidase family protein [Spirochaetales bacterium]
MRRNKQEITDKSEIERIITVAEVARLAINREGGAPYIVPMNFGYEGGTFYFHSAGAGLKLDLLKADPRVCIEVENLSTFKKDGKDSPCDWGMDYKSIIATGRAEFITDFDEKAKALKAVIAKFADEQAFPMSEKAVNAVTVFKVEAPRLSAKRSS